MIKYPRFIIEYANYKIDAIQNYNTFSEKEKADAIRSVLRRSALSACSAPFCEV